MNQKFVRPLAYVALASLLGSCTRVEAPSAPVTEPATDATEPPSVDTYTTRMLKVQTELTDIGRHTISLPQASAEFQVACKCTVIRKPTVIPPGPPPSPETVAALERGIALMQMTLEAAKAGKPIQITSAPNP